MVKAQGGNAAAGAAGGFVAASGSERLSAAFYNTKSEELFPDEKTVIVNLVAAPGAAGGSMAAGNSTGISSGANAARVEVENNALSDEDEDEDENKILHGNRTVKVIPVNPLNNFGLIDIDGNPTAHGGGFKGGNSLINKGVNETPLKTQAGVKGEPRNVAQGYDSRLPIPKETIANNGLKVESNTKHTPGAQGFRPTAGIEPKNSFVLFERSIPTKNPKIRLSIDADGHIHRFFNSSKDGTGAFHWSGSTGDAKNALGNRELGAFNKEIKSLRGNK
ncbi:VENN motif pre-toxin domain-containing protein [Cronobacter dublinensis]